MTPLKTTSYLLGAIFRPFLQVLGVKKPKRAFFLIHPVYICNLTKNISYRFLSLYENPYFG